MPAKETQVSPRQLVAQDRQKKALEMRLGGISWSRIAKHLGYASHAGAINAVHTILSRTDYEDAKGFRTLTLERLTRIMAVYWPGMLDGDIPSAKICLQTIKDMREVTGTDTPARVEHSGPEGSPIQHQVVTLDVGDIADALNTLRDAGAVRVETNGHSDAALDQLYPAPADR
jgi:hypothetical protein